MTRLPRRYLGAATIAGAIGGLIAGWVLLGWEGPSPSHALAPIPEATGLATIFTHVAATGRLSLAVFFVATVLAGIAYSVLVEFFPLLAIGAGVGFGILVWIGANEIVMPFIGLTPAPWKVPLSEQASALFGHALWGFVIGVFVHDLRARLVPQPIASKLGPPVVPVAESVAVF